MKNLLPSTLILSTVLIFAACQKQSITPDRTEVSGQATSKGRPEITRIKTATENGVMKTYTYDPNGRSLGFTSSINSSLIYQYPDASHVVETSSVSPVVHYELNSKGLAIQSVTGQNFPAFYTY